MKVKQWRAQVACKQNTRPRVNKTAPHLNWFTNTAPVCIKYDVWVVRERDGEMESARTTPRIKLFSSFCIYTRRAFWIHPHGSRLCTYAPCYIYIYSHVRLSVFFRSALVYTHTNATFMQINVSRPAQMHEMFAHRIYSRLFAQKNGRVFRVIRNSVEIRDAQLPNKLLVLTFFQEPFSWITQSKQRVL
jgi:hypothetical protein